MLRPWLAQADVAAALDWAAAVTGLDLVTLGTTGDDEAVRDTAVAQPLLVATALAVAGALIDDNRAPGVVAGHSVGEYAAAAIAGAVSPETALVLVRERGRLMAAAAAAAATGMSALLGGELDVVLASLDRLGLTAANVNGAGQVVAAGARSALDELAADPPAGARVRPLSVAGAFHTPYMESARVAMSAVAASVPTHDPRVRILANADGAVVGDGREVVDRLVAQVAAPVRWDLCMQTMRDLGVTTVIELPPAGTLTGLLRRALPGVETLALKSPDDLPAARALLERHAGTATEPAPAWRVAVAPVAGTFRPVEVDLGAALQPGGALGIVVSQRAESTVAAVHGGVLVEWLANDGDPVSPGQPVALLHPEPVLA
jgi:[acyl-carrier-protein] S-malonyltransferase